MVYNKLSILIYKLSLLYKVHIIVFIYCRSLLENGAYIIFDSIYIKILLPTSRKGFPYVNRGGVLVLRSSKFFRK